MPPVVALHGRLGGERFLGSVHGAAAAIFATLSYLAGQRRTRGNYRYGATLCLSTWATKSWRNDCATLSMAKYLGDIGREKRLHGS